MRIRKYVGTLAVLGLGVVVGTLGIDALRVYAQPAPATWQNMNVDSEPAKLIGITVTDSAGGIVVRAWSDGRIQAIDIAPLQYAGQNMPPRWQGWADLPR